MNLFYTWGAILGRFVAGAVYDRTLSYALVFAGITVSLVISAAMTSLLITPWKRLQEENQRSFGERPATHSSSR